MEKKDAGISKNPQNEILGKKKRFLYFIFYYFVINYNEFLIIV